MHLLNLYLRLMTHGLAALPTLVAHLSLAHPALPSDGVLRIGVQRKEGRFIS